MNQNKNPIEENGIEVDITQPDNSFEEAMEEVSGPVINLPEEPK